MELYIVPILAVIALFIAFIILNLRHNKSKTKSSSTKPKIEQKDETSKEEPAQTQKNSTIELTSRPNFSDLIPVKQESENEAKQVPAAERLKSLTDSKELQTNNYKHTKKETKGAKLAQEFKELSPEMKTVIFANVLDKKQD